MASILLLLCLLVSVCDMASGYTKEAPLYKIKVDGERHWFVDNYNRVRIFHGVNIVNKEFPWYYDYLLNDTRLQDLKDWGMNVVRLGTMWAGVEPKEGQYNTTYLDILSTIIQKLAAKDIYVVLDMHQDVLSTLYRSYDGVPLWIMETYPEPTNPYPWPLETIEYWEQGYTTQACSEGFQFFYNNTYQAIDKWAQFWVIVAISLGYLPSVLGYEYMNEPWIGDYFNNPELVWPGYAAQVNLVPAYEILNSAIRQVDANSIQFYEPITYGQLGSSVILGSGFTEVPGGDAYLDVSAYAYHTYCWTLEFIPSNATDQDREDAIAHCTDTLLPQMFQAQSDSVNRTGGAAFMTEFGICNGYNETSVNIECDVFLDLADDWFQSWADWDYMGHWYTSSGPNYDKVKMYSRPYAQATAGYPTAMSFDSTTLEFHLQFTPNDAILVAPTEIYVPPLHYPDGYAVDIQPAGFEWDAFENIVSVNYIGASTAIPETVHVMITAPAKVL